MAMKNTQKFFAQRQRSFSFPAARDVFPQKIKRGSSTERFCAVVIGLLFVVGVDSLLVYLALAILRSAGIVEWSPAVYQIIAFSTVTVAYRGLQRAMFFGMLSSRLDRAGM
jgi:hypothetical protein